MVQNHKRYDLCPPHNGTRPFRGEGSDTRSISRKQVESACGTILSNLHVLTTQLDFDRTRFESFCRLTLDNPVPYDFHDDPNVWFPSIEELDSWIGQARGSRQELAEAVNRLSRWMYPRPELDPAQLAALVKSVVKLNLDNGPSDTQSGSLSS